MPTRRYHRGPAKRPAKQIWAAVFNRRMLPKLLTIAGIVFLAGGATILWWSRDLPDPQNIRDGQFTESTKIYDSTGTRLLYEIGEARRTYKEINSVSAYIRNATLAAEDDQFYSHHGLDFTGLLRGVVLKPITGQRAQGGSTITQQLIKNSILTPERTLQRKVKEAVLALELEQRFSKDQILEMYLNAIPYGNRSYGVEAAAQTFFGTSADSVTLAQAAFLASLPNAPSYYSPHGSHFEDLKARQEHILNRMAALGFVTKEEAEAARQEEVVFLPPQEAIGAPHFVFYVKEQLEEEYGERVVEQGGLRVTTTLNADLQKIAEETLSTQQGRLKDLQASNAALVAIHPETGDILAMAGSIDYFNEEIDGNVNVSIRHRSPGSSIKPFIYAAAFQRGFTPDTILMDVETNFGQDYKPKNYDLREHGPVTMRTALANSLNIPAVKTLYLAGVKNSTDLAQKMGMESLNDPDRYGLSLVLGGGEVRLLDITSAYGVFAADGIKHPSRAILKVESPEETLFDASEEPPVGEPVLEAQIARLTTNILSDNNARALTFGTNSYLQLGSRPVAAKTGTTQDYRDGWAIGFTPSLAAGVWIGNNDNSEMSSRAAGANSAAPIWNAFMRKALEGRPIEQFTRPEPIQNIPHGILRGEMPEVKGKWVAETSTLYTLDCPVAVGQNRTFKEAHSLLFWVRRGSPLGPPPASAESDPQFDNWESAVRAWADRHNAKEKDNPEAIMYSSSLPTPSCNIGSEEDLPKISIVEPNTTIVAQTTFTVKVNVDSPRELREVRFLLDGKEIARRSSSDAYEAVVSLPGNFSGRAAVEILAITTDNLIGRAHRTFIVNPDDSKPSVILHTPTNSAILKPENFPQTVKVTASDPNGIDIVDILYTKEGQSGTARIGRTSTLAPTAVGRYEVSWSDSPGPGTYTVYAIAYDKTGNFTESARHTVVIE